VLVDVGEEFGFLHLRQRRFLVAEQAGEEFREC
jgi:hypothetical protein